MAELTRRVNVVSPNTFAPAPSVSAQSPLPVVTNTWAPWTGNPGDFTPYKADLGGNVYARTRQEMASGYQDLFPEQYNAYVSGTISSKELFTQSLYKAASLDNETTGAGYIGNVFTPSYNYGKAYNSMSSLLGSISQQFRSLTGYKPYY